MPKTNAKPAAAMPLDDAIDIILDGYREVLESDDRLLLEEWNAHHEQRAVRIERKKGEATLILDGEPDQS